MLENLELPRNGWESKLLLQCRRHLVVEPKRGQAVLFYNQHPDGRKDLVGHAPPPASLLSHTSIFLCFFSRFSAKNEYECHSECSPLNAAERTRVRERSMFLRFATRPPFVLVLHRCFTVVALIEAEAVDARVSGLSLFLRRSVFSF